ncbi:putative dj-1 family protein [Neofusicoccum parvum]|uniref:Dj-1 family protein n=1 Tax=Neofusicoccum parvum TaxID=310453 RepID=A0ACB5RS33_9PEZI|nr:putative dj-1 family protein [Neofusicoccum parvum]
MPRSFGLQEAFALLTYLFLYAMAFGPATHARQLEGRHTNSTLPVNYGMLLFPAFQALDVFGPLDALNILSWNHPMNLALISTTLDPVSTAPSMAAVNVAGSNFSQSVVPTHTLADAPPLDVLLVPGGLGTRAPDLNATIGFVADVFPSLQYLITICTGAGLAARAGVLDGRNATTNKKSWAATTALRKQVNWIPEARWVVDEEEGEVKVWSSSGVSAGIDATLAWMGAVYGVETAKEVADGMEYEMWTDSHFDPFAELYNLTQKA